MQEQQNMKNCKTKYGGNKNQIYENTIATDT